jgi:hypothetical protein
MLQITTRRATTLMIALAALSACDSDSTGPRVEAPVEASLIKASIQANAIDRGDATVPYSFVVFASCANGGEGEVLQVSGEMRYSGHWLTSKDGQRAHSVVVSSFTGSAVGWESGEVYDVETREIVQSNSDYGTDGIPDSGEFVLSGWDGTTRCN